MAHPGCGCKRSLWCNTLCRPAASANWLKLRAFGLTQYDAVLLVDSSAYMSGDISPLFNLPTDFAASWDQVRGTGLGRWLLAVTPFGWHLCTTIGRQQRVADCRWGGL